VGDQSGAANQPDGDQGDADVADDSVLSAEKVLSRDAKKISTPGQAACHYKGMERGYHSAHRAGYNPKFIGSKLIVKTVDALAGSGKTFAAGKYSARTARLEHKTLFVQPTKDLITETITGIRQHSSDIRLTAIHSGITEHVVADIVQHTRDSPEHQGEILFITHASGGGSNDT
jgi:hypothetical protein